MCTVLLDARTSAQLHASILAPLGDAEGQLLLEEGTHLSTHASHPARFEHFAIAPTSAWVAGLQQRRALDRLWCCMFMCESVVKSLCLLVQGSQGSLAFS
jgi:hypothetical protein